MLSENEWTVRGTTRKGKTGVLLLVVLARSDGRILSVQHGRIIDGTCR